MIDTTAFDSLEDEESRKAAKAALATLHLLGIFVIQQTIERDRIMEGADDEPIANLASSILDYRRVIQNLQTLDQLGNQYAKELNHA